MINQSGNRRLARASAGAVALAVALIAQPTWADIESDLVAYYPFEGSGSVVADASGNGHDGVLTGGARVTGKVGQALELTNKSFVTIENHDDFAFVEDYTLATWVRLNETGDFQALIAKVRDTEYKQWRLAAAEFSFSGAWEIPNGGPSGAQGGIIEADTWYHVAYVVTAGKEAEQLLYVDGTLVAKSKGSPKAHVDDTPISLGTYGGSHYKGKYFLDGVLDEVRIYARALSSADVVELMGSTQVEPPPPAGTGGGNGDSDGGGASQGSGAAVGGPGSGNGSGDPDGSGSGPGPGAAGAFADDGGLGEGDGGCSCRAAAYPSRTGMGALALFAGFFAWWRRRQRSWI